MLHRAVGACKESEPRARAFTPNSRSVNFLYHPRNMPIRVSATEPYHPRRQLRHAKTPARDAKVTFRPTRTAARAARSSFRRAKMPLGRTLKVGPSRVRPVPQANQQLVATVMRVPAP